MSVDRVLDPHNGLRCNPLRFFLKSWSDAFVDKKDLSLRRFKSERHCPSHQIFLRRNHQGQVLSVYSDIDQKRHSVVMRISSRFYGI